MNRKALIYLFTSLIVLVMSWEAQKNISIAAANELVIPEEAIRLRILANSDSPEDQWLKREIRDRVNAEITDWVTDLSSIEDARYVIEAKLDRIEEIVAAELKKIGKNEDFTVEFDDVQFPTKLYGNIVYPAGVYEAVLITIGEGEGENWWCVLFPPLCFIDFANGDAVESDEEKNVVEENVEVRLFVVDVFHSLKDRVISIFS